ncbi:hypothetical protein GCM10009128_24820 [Psychrosphaera haliotis]|uniref:hypothetical protein n=1 Tax=Psychrosphaera haliotis TaxID=555083 RepID=UPI0031D8ABD7
MKSLGSLSTALISAVIISGCKSTPDVTPELELGTSVIGSAPVASSNFKGVFQSLAKSKNATILTSNNKYGTFDWFVVSDVEHPRPVYADDSKLVGVFKQSCNGTVVVNGPTPNPLELYDLGVNGSISFEKLGLSSETLDVFANRSRSDYVSGGQIQSVARYSVGIWNEAFTSAHNRFFIEPDYPQNSYFCVQNQELVEAIWLGFGWEKSNLGDLPRNLALYFGKEIQLDAWVNEKVRRWKVNADDVIAKQKAERRKKEAKQKAARRKSEANRAKYAEYSEHMKAHKAAWSKRLTRNYGIGDEVCSYDDNKRGNVEMANGTNLKVFWAKKFVGSRYSGGNGMFFGKFPYKKFTDDYTFQLEYLSINEYQWVTKDDVSICTIDAM